VEKVSLSSAIEQGLVDPKHGAYELIKYDLLKIFTCEREICEYSYTVCKVVSIRGDPSLHILIFMGC